MQKIENEGFIPKAEKLSKLAKALGDGKTDLLAELIELADLQENRLARPHTLQQASSSLTRDKLSTLTKDGKTSTSQNIGAVASDTSQKKTGLGKETVKKTTADKESKSPVLLKVADVPPIPTVDHQRDWPADKPIDKSIFYRFMEGKPPCVNKLDLVQNKGKFIKGYLHTTQPDINPPPYSQQDEWLNAECAIVLANHLLKETMNHVLGIFQDDEFGLRDWAKERVAKAIWSNLEWQEEFPRRLVDATPRMHQIWNQECMRFFPQAAQQKVSKSLAIAAKKKPSSDFESLSLICANCGVEFIIDVPIGNERPVRFKCRNCGGDKLLGDT